MNMLECRKLLSVASEFVVIERATYADHVQNSPVNARFQMRVLNFKLLYLHGLPCNHFLFIHHRSIRFSTSRLTLPSNGLAPAVRYRPPFHSWPSAARLREPLMSNVRRRNAHPI